MTSFRRAVERHEGCPIGVAVKIPSVELVEIFKLTGFDFVLVDMEHSMLSLREVDSILAIASAVKLPALVRLPDHGYGDAQKVLDAGASGVLIPHVADRAECQQVIAQALHPPLGTRGAGGGMRAGAWGCGPHSSDYVDNATTKVARVPMIEAPAAVENADDIAQVPGVDALFVGRGDLAMALGVAATNSTVRALAEKVLGAGKAFNVPVGTVAFGAADARALVASGFDFLLAATDLGLVASESRDLLDQIRVGPSAVS